MRGWFHSEDWWAVWIGLIVFALSLGVLAGVDLLGWGVETKVWLDLSKATATVSKAYAPHLSGWASLLCTYALMLGLLSLGAAVMRFNVPRFAAGFTVIFWVSYACFLAGSNAYIAATPNVIGTGPGKFDVPWSLKLTNEAGFVIALLVGLLVGNLFPGAAAALKEAARPEWFIKTAIVILGGFLGVNAFQNRDLVQAILFRGFAAIVEAYLIYWALVYFVARKFFGFSREWAAPLASGISICGVSAAIATGAAIRARPAVPIMVSSLVVIFAVIELLFLPFLANALLAHEPMVAAAWMGLAVKTDGAATASGAVTAALIGATALKESGVAYKTEMMLATTTTVKVFIDVFIGVWAFVLSIVWIRGIHKKEGTKLPLGEIWDRFPKFVIGYFLTFLLMLAVMRMTPQSEALVKQSTAEANIFRVLFFVVTFFSIGLISNFRKLWQEGIGRLAAVYVVCLFGFIIWIGLAISWVFFHGIRPPAVGG